jgi:hypothetical protein
VPLRSVPVMFEAIKEMAREVGRDANELELLVRANVSLSAKPLGADRIDFMEHWMK